MTTINNERYVSLDVAKLLKRLGFDWECRKIYYNYPGNTDNWSLEDNYMNHNHILNVDFALLSPTLSVAQRWLREVKLVSVESQVVKLFNRNQTNDCSIFWKYIITSIDISSEETFSKIVDFDNGLEFNTYEEALEAGIKKALEIITNEQ